MTRNPLAIPLPAHRMNPRASIYIPVLGVSVLVLVIGLGAVFIGRVQARTAATASDFAEARICARSGLELAMLAVYRDPYWRKNLGNGTWFTNRAVGGGGFSVTASDPVDADVTTGDNNPVVLTCTGAKGVARYIMSMRMEVGARTGSCLEASVCAAKDVTVNGGTLTSDQTIRSNTNVNATNGAVVNGAVEAVTAVTGGTYNGSQAVNRPPSTLPDPSTVFDYYTTNGTVIAYSRLAQYSGELVGNGSFELNLSGWYALNGCTLGVNLLQCKDGLCSMRTSNRDSATDSPATDLATGSILPGHSYTLSCPVYSTGAATMRVTFTVTTTDRGTFAVSTPGTSVAANTWTDVKYTFTGAGWSGMVTKATLSVESSAVTKDFLIDAVSFQDTTYANAYVMIDQLLAPGVNPYGAPNAKGIYVLNCAGKDVIIMSSRIVGTLVMINPGANSAIRGSVCMEPADPSFPAFMTDGKVRLSLGAAPLSESAENVNFNPPGTPYPYMTGTGTNTNGTLTDALPSLIGGLVYAKDDLTIDTSTGIKGVVIGNGQIIVNATGAAVQYNNYYLNNPPPGFTAGTITMKPVPGTWQRISN
jgi:hypothetical protein